MKKVFAALLCFALLLLTACGSAEPQGESSSSPAVASTTEALTFPPDDGIFDYQKSELPKGWTVAENYCTSTYLQAVYGEEKDAPMLTISVFQYDDAEGASKAKNLAQAVKIREQDTVSDISEVEFGKLPFYLLHFASKATDGKLRYEAYGQSKPDKENNYRFVIICFENVQNDKQFQSLKNVLDCVEFTF